VGRYKYSGPIKVTLSGSVAGERKTFTFPATLSDPSVDESNGFVEKLWATRRIGEIIDELDLRGHNQELVDEMVQLSIRHGIITPYTSFLADENVRLADREGNSRRGALGLERDLAKLDGKPGVVQREYKGRLKEAEMAPVGAGRYASKAKKGMASGEAVLNQKINISKGQAAITQDAAGEAQVVDSVRNIGQKSFFYKEQRWQDSTVTPEQAKNAVRVAQFSAEYFDLAASHGGTLAKYLAFDEPILVNLGAKTYQIDPAQPEDK
jgi:Ca-activated chloride channel family protein